MSLIDKTIKNMDELVQATKAQTEPFPQTELQKQQRYVASSLQRCRRCGDHTMSIVTTQPLTLLCGDCQAILRKHDEPLMWFSDMVIKLQANFYLFAQTKM